MCRSISRRGAIAGGVGLAVSACASPSLKSVTGSPVMETRTLKRPNGMEVRADFGRITVPAVRAKPSAGACELAFVWLHAADSQGGAPIVYLNGGPGSPTTAMIQRPNGWGIVAPLLEATDVILFDQRGTGESKPLADWRWDGAPPTNFFASREAALDHLFNANRRAIAAINAKGVPLAGFTTEESADDVDDLRKALGLEKVSICGFSYGAHLGLSVLRRHGAKIERAILIGVEGPDDTYKLPLTLDQAFDNIAHLAAADPNVSAVGNLWDLRDRVRSKLAAKPMPVRIQAGPLTFSVPVGAYALDLILRADIGDATDIPVFPRLLKSIDDGNDKVLGWFVDKRISAAYGVSGMSMMMDSSSGASAARLQRIQKEAKESRFGDAANFPYPDIAQLWPVTPLSPDFHAPVISSVPTLLLAGDLDWNTPPVQAEAVARNFSNAMLITVRNAGHEQIYFNRDARTAVTQFLRGESVSGVAPSNPAIRFVPLEGTAGPTHPSIENS